MQRSFVTIFSLLNEINDSVVEPVRRLRNMSPGVPDVAARWHLEVVQACLDTVARQLQAVLMSRNPAELLQHQLEIARDWENRLLLLIKTERQRTQSGGCHAEDEISRDYREEEHYPVAL